MADCEYRREELRLEPCQECRGSVMVRVYKCQKWGECTIGKAIPGLHVCDGQPATPSLPVSPYSSVLPGILLTLTRSDTPIAIVRTDDGRVIEAHNDRCRVGHVHKRCVVGLVGERWVLVQ